MRMQRIRRVWLTMGAAILATGIFAPMAGATTSTQLSGMAITEPFDGSEVSEKKYSTDWSKLAWASEKGYGFSVSGWRPQGSYPTVNGAFDTATVTDAGSGIAAVATMTEEPGNPERYFSLWLDASGSAESRTGYELQFTVASSGGSGYEVKLSKWQSGENVVLSSKSHYAFSIGDSLALLDQGGTVSAWTKTGAEFSELLSASDATFGGGNAGVEGAGNRTRLANFKVGALLNPVESMNEALENLTVVNSFETNESPLSGSGTWTALNWANGTSGHNTGRVFSGWGPFDAYPTVNGAYWNKATFVDTGAGTAAAATLAEKPSNTSRYVSLWLDMPSPASAHTGYELRLTETSSGIYEVALSKWQSGSKTVLASKASYSFPTGKQFALADKAGTVSAWTNTEGEGYVQLLSASDSTFTSGYSGIEGAGNITRLKGFRSGQLPPF